MTSILAISAARWTSWLIVTSSSDPMLSGSRLAGLHQLDSSLDAVVDLHERSRLQPFSPDLGFVVSVQLCVITSGQMAAGAFSRPLSHVPHNP